MPIVDQRSTLPPLVSFSSISIGQVYELVDGTIYRKISSSQAIALDNTWNVSTPAVDTQCRPRVSLLIIQD